MSTKSPASATVPSSRWTMQDTSYLGVSSSLSYRLLSSHREILHVSVWDLWRNAVVPRSENPELLCACRVWKTKVRPSFWCVPRWVGSLLPNLRCAIAYAVSTACLSLTVLRRSRTRSVTALVRLRDWGTLTYKARLRNHAPTYRADAGRCRLLWSCASVDITHFPRLAQTHLSNAEKAQIQTSALYLMTYLGSRFVCCKLKLTGHAFSLCVAIDRPHWPAMHFPVCIFLARAGE